MLTINYFIPVVAMTLVLFFHKVLFAVHEKAWESMVNRL